MKEQFKKAAEIAEKLGWDDIYEINVTNNNITINASFSDDIVPRIFKLGFKDETRDEDEFFFFKHNNVTVVLTD